MFIVPKEHEVLWLARDKNTGRFMGFDEPRVFWSEKAAKFAIDRQRTRKMSDIDWEVVPVILPKRP